MRVLPWLFGRDLWTRVVGHLNTFPMSYRTQYLSEKWRRYSSFSVLVLFWPRAWRTMPWFLFDFDEKWFAWLGWFDFCVCFSKLPSCPWFCVVKKPPHLLPSHVMLVSSSWCHPPLLVLFSLVGWHHPL